MDLDKLIGTLVQAGAPALGSILGSAIGGPVGTVVGGAAGKVLAELGAALGTPATPEAIAAKIEADPGAAAVAVAQVESRAAEIMAEAALVEAKRAAENDKAEREASPKSWLIYRSVIQAIVWGGWAVILVVALFGGNFGTRPLVEMAAVLNTWGLVTSLWIAAFHGGHTLKSVFPNGFTRTR